MAFIAATKAPIKPTLKAMKTFLLETDRALIRSSLITFGWLMLHKVRGEVLKKGIMD